MMDFGTFKFLHNSIIIPPIIDCFFVSVLFFVGCGFYDRLICFLESLNDYKSINIRIFFQLQIEIFYR